MNNFYKLFSTAGLFFTIGATFAQNLNVTYQSNVPNANNHTMANICGYADGSGNEYALCGTDDGMTIVDVTIPNSPVSIVQIPNINDLWKEIKVYRNFAYVTTEGGGGLQIVNLNALPSTTLGNYTYHNYTGDGAILGQLNSIHALHIDTTLGFCYLFGSNLFSGGAVVLDLNADPYNPTFMGNYTNPAHNYVHDGYVDNDTLYAGHIYDGYMCVVDMTNKTAPVVLATQQTPTAFTHNTWPSNDKRYVFTTDENTNSYLTCYDISNLSNVQETDRIQSQNPNSGSIVHNTHILNNWAVTSWYKDGFVITDVTRPYNLVNVGWYDTYPTGGNGFNGTWGVYPFLPSGTIVVSNMEDGLFVFSPNYVRACYLEGIVKDSICNTPLSGVTVTISIVNVTDQSDVNGEIRTGTAVPGTYNVTFTKNGYLPYVMNNVVFSPGIVDTFNIKMYSANAVAINGHAQNALTSASMQNVQVLFNNPNGSYNYVSDASGNFTNCSMVAATYQIEAAAWGYNTICMSDSIYNGNSTPVFSMVAGYEDDFTFDLGWTVATTASTGAWERGVPIGTTYLSTNDANPGVDVSTDCLDQCYVTGNSGGSASQDDVDGGATTLTSPIFDLSTTQDPWIHYSRWFFNAGGSGNPNDSLVIKLTDGTTTKTLEKVTASSVGNSSWIAKSFRVSNYFAPTATMRMIVTTADNTPGHLVEAGFDHFVVADSINGINNPTLSTGLSVYPNPFDGSTNVHFVLNAQPVSGAFIEVQDISGRVVLTQIVNTAEGTISLGSDLTGGIYFVRIVNGTEVSKTVQLVKTR